MSQTTETGVAVAVAVMPPAVAGIGVHCAGSIHSQFSRLTMAFPPDGAVETVGAGRFRLSLRGLGDLAGRGGNGGLRPDLGQPFADFVVQDRRARDDIECRGL